MKYRAVSVGCAYFFVIAAVYPMPSKRVRALGSDNGPEFSAKHGFYRAAFDVIVSAQAAGTVIQYTFDGSDPRTSPTAVSQNSPAAIHIDPDSLVALGTTSPGVALRVCTLAPDSSLSETITQTYLFLEKIGLLSPHNTRPGPDWPDTNWSASPQMINYGMDPDVLNDPRYKNQIEGAMLAVPTISIVTDLRNLFSPDSGIYMNALQDGAAWERPASIELLNPDSTEGFQIDAGLRIRGGWSRHGDCPKHAFRLFFRSEYGKAKLKYPLFGSEGAGEFDKIDLRTGQNYSWSYPGHLGQYNTMISDEFCRDLQREMGQPYTRSRFYHLYLNGVYWGLYQTQERSEARYAESYFGGSVDDYDVIKVDDNYSIEATDGNMDAYTQVWNICSKGFKADSNYFKLQGLNADGTRNSGYKVLVDIDNLIDYMLDIFFTGNYDSPTSQFGGNSSPNNYYCILNRNGSEGFKFFVHDAEHTLRTTAGEGPGIGLNENRVSITMSVSGLSKFHPQWLHYKLSDNAEYRIRFADHVYKHFFNGGCLTSEKTKPLFLSLAKEIELAIIGESARWGDTYMHPPGTKDDYWLPAVNDIANDYLQKRPAIVLNQLKAAVLYPTLNPPVFQHDGEGITAGGVTVPPGYILRLVSPNLKGSIRYTVDSRDPRAIGGSASTSSLDGGAGVDLPIYATTKIKARVQDSTAWSALHEITLYVDPSSATVESTAKIPASFRLYQNYPNPFNPRTVVSYQLPVTSRISLKVYDVLGREVATITDGVKEAGYYTATFDGSEFSSSVYLMRFVAQTQEGKRIVRIKKMLMIK
jgi:hypothetical protein